MTELFIKDEDLTSLKGKTIIVTGGSSGIGLASVNLFLSLGASVVNGDIKPPPPPAKDNDTSTSFRWLRTDVTVWTDLVALFKTALELGNGSRRVDHVYANAGVSPRAAYLDMEEARVDEATGDPLEPSHATYDVNLRGVINTTALALYYMRRQDPVGGSVVLGCSIGAMQRFRAVDYCASKHGVLGFMRGLRQVLEEAKVPVRVNATAPSWTQGGMVPEKILAQLGEPLQSPAAVARGAALLMADGARQGHVLHIARGRYKEVEEAVLLPAYEKDVLYEDTNIEDDTLRRVLDALGGVYRDQV
ncbi:hypothetical protein SLS62_010931 [Diatrype stigma]|uniref:Uncharacterized protein n=1 Tax=Diatrype stigma TaxID=117547 RepID=A0AAN9UF42_9PEZI